MDVKFTYYTDVGQWYIEFTNPEDYLNLPHLAKHFSLMWRFKPAPNSLAEPEDDFIDFESYTVHEGSGDIFVYERATDD